MNNTLKHFNANFHVRKLLGNVTVGHMKPIDSIKKQADILKKNAPGEMLTNLICGLNEVFDVSFDKFPNHRDINKLQSIGNKALK